jgi:excisionase family DNA binding protein
VLRFLRLQEINMTTSALLASETYEARDDAAIARVHDFLEAHAAVGRERPAARYLLAGATAGDQVELPEEVYLVLRQAVEAMQRGLSVTISPQSRELTTQQAADLLSVSRPTVIKILDEGKLPFDRVGTHRKIRLADLLAFREQRRQEQYAALDAMSIDLDDETPLGEVLEELRAARRTVAARRRG